MCVSTYAQTTLTLQIQDSLQSPLPFAYVSVHPATAPDLIYKAGQTDKTGWLTFDGIHLTDSCIVKASFLGYAPYQGTLVFGSGDTIRTTITLREAGNQLPTATVKSKPIKFTLRGDTVTFHPTAYLRGNERTLGDLISNIPELTLSANGEIEFNGKAVDGVLIEGLDVLNGRQRSATQDLSVEHILALEVIENYRGPADFLFGETGKTVVNVKLKEGGKKRWIGRHDYGLGPPRYFTGTTGLTNVNSRRGWNIKFAGNSTGEAALTAKDYLNAQPSMGEVLSQQSGQFNLNDILPAGLAPPPALQANAEGILSLGYQRKGVERPKVTAGLLGQWSDRTAGRDFIRRVLNDVNNPLIGAESTDARQNVFFGNVKIESSTTRSDSAGAAELRVGYNLVDNDDSVGQEIDDRGQTTRYTRNLNGQEVNMAGSWRLPSSGRYSHRLQSKGKVSSELHHLSATDAAGLRLPAATTLSNTVYQRRNLRKYQAQTRWLTRYVYEKWELDGQTNVTTQGYEFQTQDNFLVTEQEGTLSGTESSIGGRARAKYSVGKHSISGVLEAEYVNRNSVAVSNYRQGKIDGSLFLKRKLNALNFLLLQVYHRRQPAANLYQESNATEWINLRTIVRYDAPTRAREISSGGQLSYLNRNLLNNRTSLVTTLGLSHRAQGLVQISEPANDFFVRSYAPLRNATAINASWQSITNLGSARLVFNATFNQLDQRGSNQFNALDITTFGTDTKLTFPKLGIIDLSLTLGTATTRQLVDETEISVNATRYGLNGGFEVGKFRLSLGLSQQIDSNTAFRTSNYLGNAAANYRIGTSQWEVFLRANNFTQFNPTPLTNATVSDNELTQYTFRQFPGFVLVGAQCLL